MLIFNKNVYLGTYYICLVYIFNSVILYGKDSEKEIVLICCKEEIKIMVAITFIEYLKIILI